MTRRLVAVCSESVSAFHGGFDPIEGVTQPPCVSARRTSLSTRRIRKTMPLADACSSRCLFLS
jgi:hypothetical protein